jgi:hypothetical protein
MKAVVIHQYGGPEVLSSEEYPDPIPGATEVLVRLAATHDEAGLPDGAVHLLTTSYPASPATA